jgi:hypothetical protein
MIQRLNQNQKENEKLAKGQSMIENSVHLNQLDSEKTISNNRMSKSFIIAPQKSNLRFLNGPPEETKLNVDISEGQTHNQVSPVNSDITPNHATVQTPKDIDSASVQLVNG